MMKNSPRLPTASKTNKNTSLSPRKSYIASLPSDIPGFPSPVKPGRSITERSLIVTKESEALLPKELAKELKNGSRQEVGVLERWTHEQLALIHSNNTSGTGGKELTGAQKQKQYSEQIKVIDTSMELLNKMVEVHCIDKAQLLRKVWASSGDLYQALYKEQSSVIHDLKLSLSEKTSIIARLEDSVERLRASTALEEQSGHKKTAENPSKNRSSITTYSTHKNDTLSQHEKDQIRLVQEELHLKNQEMMQLEGILTSLSVWFPNFTKFNTSVLSKYLPPVDYLEQKEEEEEKLAEENKQKTQQQAAELKARADRGALWGIGETAVQEEGSLEAQLKKEKEKLNQVELAQDFLLRDLKRLQGMGVGFAVLDPTEYEATREILANSLACTAAPEETSDVAPAPAHVPQVVSAALNRTSVAMRNKLNSRWRSFVEVQGDEYVLRKPMSGEAVMEESEGDVGEDSPRSRGATSGNTIAAAAAAVRHAFQIDTSAEPAAASTQPSAPATPVLGEYNCSDYYKLQNVRVTKVNAQEAAKAVATLAADISLKRRPDYYKNREQKLGSFGMGEGENTADSYSPSEYEKKYRTLLIDAQKMEVAQNKAETRIKEEQKAHHKQLLRLSALITTLQNKLQQSNQTASDKLSQIPHVLFPPMIPRIPRYVQDERCLSHYASEVAPIFLHKDAFIRSERVSPAQVCLQGERDSSLHVLLNNTSAHRHRVKFGPPQEPPSSTASVCEEDGPVDSFTEELSKLTTSSNTGQRQPCGERVNTGVFCMDELLSLSEIEQILTRFCAHFVQSAPYIPHASAADNSKRTAASVGIRDELYAAFGQGPDQYTHSHLDSMLNGQQARLFPLCCGSSGEVFSLHLLQYLSMRDARVQIARCGQRECAFAVYTLQRMRQSVVHFLGQAEPYTATTTTVSSLVLPLPDALSQQRPQQRALLACLQQLLGLLPATASSGVLNSAEATEADFSYLAHMTTAEPRQRALRERVFFDLYLHCFRAMQRYIVRDESQEGQAQDSSFPVSATERILRRVFAVVPEESRTSHHPQGKNVTTTEMASSPPWWRCISARSLQMLKQELERLAINEHRAVAVQQMLSADFASRLPGAMAVHGDCDTAAMHNQDSVEGASRPPQPRVGVYDCIQLCMRAAEKQHNRLMKTLTYMYRFLQSLHIRGGVQSRTFHLLLAHFLQQGYPSVQDTSAGFSISAISAGAFSFAPKTAIVVNLELMLELQRLQTQGQLNQWTFADGVLRSQPYFLVHALFPMLEHTATQNFRAKLISEGAGHLAGLKQMLQRSFQHHLQQQSDASETPLQSLPVDAAAGADAVPMSRFKQSYLISKHLFPAGEAEEAQFAEDIRQPSPTTVGLGHSTAASASASRSAEEERLLLQELVGYTDALGVSETEWIQFTSRTTAETSRVQIDPFVERLLLHGKLSYDENITGVMAPSLAEVALTTWALQYVVETLSRLRGASVRLKNIFQRDLQATFALAVTESTRQQGTFGPSIGGSKHAAPSAGLPASQQATQRSNQHTDISSIGDRILVDLLLGDGCCDLDTFVKVEAHYMLQLQRRVFGAWSRPVEDRAGQLRD